MPRREDEPMQPAAQEHLDEGIVHAWIDGALTPDEQARVAAHVDTCAPCAALVAEARGFAAGASRILSALDAVPGDVIPGASGPTMPAELAALARAADTEAAGAADAPRASTILDLARGGASTTSVAARRRRRWSVPARAAAALLILAGGTSAVVIARGGLSEREASFSADEAEEKVAMQRAPATARAGAANASAAGAPASAAPAFAAAPQAAARAEVARTKEARTEASRVAENAAREREAPKAMAPVMPPAPPPAPLAELAGKRVAREAAPPVPAPAPAAPMAQERADVAVAPPAAPPVPEPSPLQARVAPPAVAGGVARASGYRAAPSGAVSGTVTSDDGRAIPSASVSVSGTALRAVTDEGGHFVLRDVTPGSVEVRARAIGFRPSVDTVTVASGDTAQAHVALTRDVNQLSQMVVTGVDATRDRDAAPRPPSARRAAGAATAQAERMAKATDSAAATRDANVARLAGCYAVDVELSDATSSDARAALARVPRRLTLHARRDGAGNRGYAVSPAPADGVAYWQTLGGDAVRVVWTERGVGASMRLTLGEGELRGTATPIVDETALPSRPAVARRAGCEGR